MRIPSAALRGLAEQKAENIQATNIDIGTGAIVQDNLVPQFTVEVAGPVYVSCAREFAKERWMAEYSQQLAVEACTSRGEVVPSWATPVISVPARALGPDRCNCFTARDCRRYLNLNEVTNNFRPATLTQLVADNDEDWAKKRNSLKGKMNMALKRAEVARRVAAAVMNRFQVPVIEPEVSEARDPIEPSRPIEVPIIQESRMLWVYAMYHATGGNWYTAYPSLVSRSVTPVGAQIPAGFLPGAPGGPGVPPGNGGQAANGGQAVDPAVNGGNL